MDVNNTTAAPIISARRGYVQMSEFPMHFDSPEDAYFGFFEADRAQDARAWAAVMSYPHVRVAAAGTTDYFATPGDYAAAADWTARKATGWAYTRGQEPVRLHESGDRMHLAAGWTRYNPQDEPILWNRVTYILTRPAESWGVQARFALGSYVAPDAEAPCSEAAESAIGRVRHYYEAIDRQDTEACAGLCRFPMVDVGVGEVAWIESGAQLANRCRWVDGNIRRLEVTPAQSGADGAIVAVNVVYDNGAREQSVVIVGRKRDGWRIAGISRIVGEAD